MMMRLLPASALLQTSEIDHPDWNYRPVLRVVQRLRFRMVLKMLGGKELGRLLEVGYGSGIFMPELAWRCQHLDGVDVHPHAVEVRQRLAFHGVAAQLATAGVENLPYDDGTFDCVVAVSTLECVQDIDTGCREIARVLKPGGFLVVVTPGSGRLWDAALRMSTGENAGLYGDGRQRLQPTLRRHFRVTRRKRVLFGLYTAYRLEPR
ncbi:class I SAM-dependent methyltransferase [Allorhizocola rhizosphaerae]|uniref:class I SAM-dependent methyltransferase n=1 Tax=Allorhizocola rhizosphaerae TaxID=1872709 RepID=UPI000E3C2286|nr:class I SAM-dependent methyltransferase [Allorhizocola rhizosphaerae]